MAVDVTKPFPPDWQSRPDYIRYRIMRLQRALPYCRGRAQDIRGHVEMEIHRLRLLLLEAEHEAMEQSQHV